MKEIPGQQNSFDSYQEKKTVRDRTEDNRIGSRSFQGQSSELFSDHQNKRQIVNNNKITEAKVRDHFYTYKLLSHSVSPGRSSCKDSGCSTKTFTPVGYFRYSCAWRAYDI